jgi:uncharacterized protein YdeI (YjbR/CyaY-like superfamily)
MSVSKVAEPILAFKNAKAFETWLAREHKRSGGLLLRLYKKSSGVPSVSYDEALDAALCYGWIDAVKRSYDADSWLQRFCPRTPRSAWSKRNTEHAQRLIKAKRMKPAGLAAVDAAKKDGRWKSAYDAPSRSQVPADFLAALAKNKKALAFFRSLNRANQYAIAYRLQTAKQPETRQRRFETLLEMMETGKRIH